MASPPPMKTDVQPADQSAVTDIVKPTEAEMLAKSTFPEIEGINKKPIESGSYKRNPLGVRVYNIQGTDESQARRILRRTFKGSLFLGAVCGYYIYQISSNPEGEYVATPNTTFALRLFPMRKLSRYWGQFAESDHSKYFIKAYSSIFNCNEEECLEPIASFNNLQEFFTRKLKDGSRPFSSCDDKLLSSPCDATVARIGEVVEGDHDSWIGQIKGYHYRLTDLLRFSPQPVPANCRRVYCVLYLAPGDYHRFHVPVDSWKVAVTNHIVGNLFPVNQLSYKFIDELFCLNERISLNGSWKHGTFCCSLVGAYNVGSIVVDFDKSLTTQKESDDAMARESLKERRHYTSIYHNPKSPGKGGDEMGHFRMGSTIVLISDVPTDWQWNVAQGDTTKAGKVLMSKSA